MFQASFEAQMVASALSSWGFLGRKILEHWNEISSLSLLSLSTVSIGHLLKWGFIVDL